MVLTPMLLNQLKIKNVLLAWPQQSWLCFLGRAQEANKKGQLAGCLAHLRHSPMDSFPLHPLKFCFQ